MTRMLDVKLDERTPHIDRAWAYQTIYELRAAGVGSQRIGSTLLEVESHMAEQGGDVWDSFGDPKDYVSRLALPREGKTFGAADVLRILAVLLAALVAAPLLMHGAVRYFGGDGLSLTAVGVPLLAAGAAAVAIVQFSLLEPILKRPVVSALIAFPLVVGVGFLAYALPAVTIALSWGVSVTVGLIAFALVVGLLVVLPDPVEQESAAVTFPDA